MESEHPTGYSDTVATTRKMSFDAAERQVSSAADLLALCAYMAADNIPKSLFSDAPSSLAEEFPLVANKLEFNRALAALQRYSLITIAQDTVSIHRLI
ncbi:MAG: DUF7779 domain-containing protein [Halobacteriota archaeon]